MRDINESLSEIQISRLKKVLIVDKLHSPTRLIGVLKSDLCNVLRSYMDMKDDDLKISISMDNRGMYNVNIYVTASRMKALNSLP
jgi:septum formation topological specificity factor MinE